MRTQLIALGLLATTGLAQPLATGPAVRYDGYKVVRVRIESVRDLQVMQALDADQWAHRIEPGVPADFMISPEVLDELDASGLGYEVVIENVQEAVDAENARLAGGGAGRAWFDDFKNLDEINAYMDTLAAANPGLATVVDLGPSLQGRSIRGLRIANDAVGNSACEPSVLYNACQHAREWISPMVAMYAADRLLASYSSDPDIQRLIDHTEIMIVPVSNPDGYVYTWTNDRYWRKNRRNNGDGSTGVDINRNWGYQWGLNNGSDPWGWSDVYRGTAPFSEPETQRLRDWSASRPNLAAHIDLHSFGQYVLWPWGYTGQQPPDAQTFSQVGNQIKQEIKNVHNRTYTAGQCYTTLYPVSGGANDWFWGEIETHSFTIELRGNDFVLPRAEIIPNSEEIYPALVYFAEWGLDTRGPVGDFNDDGAWNTLDVLAYLNAYAARDPDADINGDGAVNTLDVTAFLNAWNARC
ncbi:MAG TPA: M14 family zinc carboxypeptidase [Phycisphaerales bacterium]|nr:M14 family zinc carboxypeptidase [Phycisphaerales bacterium]